MSEPTKKRDPQNAADIIADAGGTVVGRTRLQKLAYLLELTGLGEGFEFQYRHYGPYSETLATATRDAALLGLIAEDVKPASWGGFYSVFTTTVQSNNAQRSMLTNVAIGVDSIVLELAATAAFLREEGFRDPWGETERRKPEKTTDGRLELAKKLYRTISEIPTPRRLPDIG